MIQFALRAIAWSLGLFGFIRLAWFESVAILPLTLTQGRLALHLFGPPMSPVDITLACSGADALALCAGVILAYRAPWNLRLLGAMGGTALILALNTIRIGVLGRVAHSPFWFDAVHLYLAPFGLALFIAGYVYAWMLFANRRAARDGSLTPGAGATHPSGLHSLEFKNFALIGTIFSLAFLGGSSIYLESPRVLAVATSIASSAVWVLGFLGIAASAAGNLLFTPRGAFLVTQECVTTPLIPVYLAAVVTLPATWPRRVVGLLGAIPLFYALGVLRLLVVALPSTIVSSPLFVVHAFYQMALGVGVVLLAARLRHGPGGVAVRRGLLGCAAGVTLSYGLGTDYARVLRAAAGAHLAPVDSQGVLESLPAFQVGLFVALAAAAFASLPWRSLTAGLGLLVLSHLGLFATLALSTAFSDFVPHARDLRAWALAGPLLLFALLFWHEGLRGRDATEHP